MLQPKYFGNVLSVQRWGRGWQSRLALAWIVRGALFLRQTARQIAAAEKAAVADSSLADSDSCLAVHQFPATHHMPCLEVRRALDDELQIIPPAHSQFHVVRQRMRRRKFERLRRAESKTALGCTKSIANRDCISPIV